MSEPTDGRRAGARPPPLPTQPMRFPRVAIESLLNSDSDMATTTGGSSSGSSAASLDRPPPARPRDMRLANPGLSSPMARGQLPSMTQEMAPDGAAIAAGADQLGQYNDAGLRHHQPFPPHSSWQRNNTTTNHHPPSPWADPYPRIESSFASATNPPPLPLPTAIDSRYASSYPPIASAAGVDVAPAAEPLYTRVQTHEPIRDWRPSHFHHGTLPLPPSVTDSTNGMSGGDTARRPLSTGSLPVPRLSHDLFLPRRFERASLPMSSSPLALHHHPPRHHHQLIPRLGPPPAQLLRHEPPPPPLRPYWQPDQPPPHMYAIPASAAPLPQVIPRRPISPVPMGEFMWPASYPVAAGPTSHGLGVRYEGGSGVSARYPLPPPIITTGSGTAANIAMTTPPSTSSSAVPRPPSMSLTPAAAGGGTVAASAQRASPVSLMGGIQAGGGDDDDADMGATAAATGSAGASNSRSYHLLNRAAYDLMVQCVRNHVPPDPSSIQAADPDRPISFKRWRRYDQFFPFFFKMVSPITNMSRRLQGNVRVVEHQLATGLDGIGDGVTDVAFGTRPGPAVPYEWRLAWHNDPRGLPIVPVEHWHDVFLSIHIRNAADGRTYHVRLLECLRLLSALYQTRRSRCGLTPDALRQMFNECECQHGAATSMIGGVSGAASASAATTTVGLATAPLPTPSLAYPPATELVTLARRQQQQQQQVHQHHYRGQQQQQQYMDHAHVQQPPPPPPPPPPPLRSLSASAPSSSLMWPPAATLGALPTPTTATSTTTTPTTLAATSSAPGSPAGAASWSGRSRKRRSGGDWNS
ncbi:hypothetical protein BC828DRAFT_291026 [Blastocladiella britannica]|nr:hypothetical protein BC828DRAFT_291026 [Blastocladiella britannica]